MSPAPRSARRTRGLQLLGVAVLAGAAPTSEAVRFADELPTTLNPLFAATMADVRAQELIFDRLVYRSALHSDDDSRLLVKNDDALGSLRRETLDGGAAVRLWVRQDVRWQDGEPLTADDVCFTIDAMLANPGSSIALPVRPPWTGCRTEPGNVAVIALRPPARSAGANLSFPVLPKHAFPNGFARGTPFDRAPVGTGPMRARFEGDSVVFDAVPSAVHAPTIPRLILTPTADAAAAVLDGRLDGAVDVPPADRRAIVEAHDVALKSNDLRRWWYVAVNTHHPALADVRVRAALDRALDREALIGATGTDPNDDNPPLELITGPFVMSSPFYNRAVKPVPHADLDAVAANMRAAGAERRSNVWRLDGRAITLRLGLPERLHRELPNLLAVLERQLEDAGFRVTPSIVPDGPDARGPTRVEDLDLLVGAWSDATLEDPNPLLHTRDVPAGKGTYNVFDYGDASVDALLDAFDAARTDTEAREAMWSLHARVAEERPLLFLWALGTKSAWRTTVHSNTIGPYFYFTAFDSWRVAR